MFGYSSYVFCKGTLFSSILLSFCLFHDIFIAFLTLLMHDAWGWKVFSLLYMMLGRYLGTGTRGGLYLVSGCVLSVKVQPSGLLQELSWLMLAHPLFPVKYVLR